MSGPGRAGAGGGAGARRRGRGPRVEVRRRDGGLELRVDDTFASWYRPGEVTTGSVWDALAAPLLALPPARRRRIAILGLGGGSAARVARALAPEAELVGVEISAEVLAVARERFDLGALRLRVVRADARAWLGRTRGRFDAILDDVFVGAGPAVRKPAWHLEEGLPRMAARLAPGGVLASNTLDEWRAVLRAVQGRFPAAAVIEVDGYDNRIVVGGPPHLSGRSLRSALCRDPILGRSGGALRFRSARPSGDRPGRRGPAPLPPAGARGA